MFAICLHIHDTNFVPILSWFVRIVVEFCLHGVHSLSRFCLRFCLHLILLISGTQATIQASPNNSSQLVDVNKFIDKQKGKLSTLAMCGCNTQLLSAYTECRLCGKFCFPDFRLSGAQQKIDLCENCVETVLTLCLPSDPEVLEVGEECLALQTDKVCLFIFVYVSIWYHLRLFTFCLQFEKYFV